MALFFALPLALLSIALLAWPIVRRGRPASSSISPLDPLEEVRRRQQQIYEGIQTLILDYELGHVPDEEYEEEMKAHRLRAAYALREQEQLQQALSFSQRMEELENEVLELRKSWGTVKGVTICNGCGGERDLNAVLCPRCELSRDEEVGSVPIWRPILKNFGVPLVVLNVPLAIGVFGFLLGIIPGLLLGLPSWHKMGAFILAIVYAWGYISQRRTNFRDVNWVTYLIAASGALGIWISVRLFGTFTD